MAVNSYDPTTGRPIFLDTDAPDIKVDPTAAGIYAAEVGNRIVKSNFSALDAYAYKRAGLLGHALDTKSDYVHDGTGWRLWNRVPQTYTPTLTNISGSPTVTARYSVAGGRVSVSITMVLTGANVGAAPGFSLPVTSRTPTGFQMLGQATYRKSGSWIEGAILLATSTRVDPVLKLVSGATINMSTNVNASSPFTWASGDSMTLEFSYEAA